MAAKKSVFIFWLADAIDVSDFNIKLKVYILCEMYCAWVSFMVCKKKSNHI